MANDINIRVSAELGDTLLKLDLAKHAVSSLGDSSAESAVKQDEAAASTGLFSSMISALTSTTTVAIPMLGSLTVPIAALPLLAFAAAAAVVALADAIGTVIAIAADFIAPISLVAGLLGSLGLGFVLAGQRAAKGGGALQPFADAVATLGSMFHRTTDILAHAFLPYLLQLAGAAEKALLFIDKLAHMSLAEAFRTMSTQGVQMLSSFVNQVTAVLAHPIRLALKIAFGTGPGGNEISSLVSSWWTRFSDFFFGYTQTHQVHIGRFLGPMTKTQVDGVFQPIIDWFNRHNFTKQGIKIGHELLQGLKPFVQPLGQFIANVLDDAFKTVLRNSVAVFGQLWTWLEGKNRQFADHLGTYARDAAGAAKGAIEAQIGAAWSWVEQKAKSIWQSVISFLESPLSIHINWPSPPGWLQTLFGLGGGGSSSGGGSSGGPGGGRTFTGTKPPTSGIASSIAGGGGLHIHIHGGTFTDAASRRREAAMFGQEVSRRWMQQVGG